MVFEQIYVSRASQQVPTYLHLPSYVGIKSIHFVPLPSCFRIPGTLHDATIFTTFYTIIVIYIRDNRRSLF